MEDDKNVLKLLYCMAIAFVYDFINTSGLLNQTEFKDGYHLQTRANGFLSLRFYN